MSGRASFDLNGLLFVQRRPGNPAVPAGHGNEQVNKLSSFRSTRQTNAKNASNRVAPVNNLHDLENAIPIYLNPQTWWLKWRARPVELEEVRAW